MKRLILIATALFFFQISHAQFLQWGPKVSISSSSVKPGDLIVLSGQDFQDLKLAFKSSKSSLQLGGFLRFNIGGLYLQPEVMFSTSKLQYTWQDFAHTSADAELREEKFVNVDLPIMAGFKLGPLRFQGGPVYKMVFNSSSELVDVDGFGRKFRESSLDLRLGVGADLGPVLLDVYYQAPLKKGNDVLVVDGEEFQLNSGKSMVGASLGFAF